ncbi:hypothetical protein L9F63_022494 [Diploptera punctata]|uniref:Uncharacterized protein n=1 Tax=Diploptera punctata TaxID=6984 RepID=A0AAD7ZMK9_DIPPU|nr:hypothetical protein L9F63_022494 [Diploptera punctata]
MVYAFMIQTLDSKECGVIYYRAFTCYSNIESDNTYYLNNSNGESGICGHFRPHKLFETSTEMKELLQHVANKVQMQYSMKMKHSLAPVELTDSKEAFAKGIFMERKWKKESGLEIPIVWQCAPGLGFVLLCNRRENIVQAHNVLSIIIQQLEKHLQFVSNPAMALALVETVALIVNQFLPSGQLLFMNSRLVRQFEKQLEHDLFSK